MPIQVTCPGCLKRFSVSEKFAGKTGPCPSCQKTIKIPDKSDEVVIHAPEAGPKDSKGRPVLKPIRRSEVKLKPPVIIGVSVGCLAILAIALGLGLSGSQPGTAILAIGSLLLAAPVVFVGYWFLRDDELAGYLGRPLLIRVAICSVGFAFTWGVYAFIPMYLSDHQSMSEITGIQMAIFVPIMIVIGTVVSVLVFEFEVLSGVMHYVLYFAITFFLAWLAGAHLSEPLSGGGANPPEVNQGTVPGAAVEAPPSNEPPPQSIPKLLQ